MNGKFLDRLIKPSTREFMRTARHARDFSLYDFLHGYIYGRWPYLYISIGTGEHPLAKKYVSLKTRFTAWFTPGNGDGKQPGTEMGANPPEHLGTAAGYHGKVVPLEAARQLVTIREEIEMPDLEQVIPYPRARAIIMKNPDHLVALECPCRSARENPCTPLDVCLVVGEPFASFVIEHSPERARWITPDEATQILKEEDARGHVHHAFFKDAMFGRFYAICNCCSCCCGAMNAQKNGTPMLASSGYVCQVDEMFCLGCEICTQYCQFEALSVPLDYAQVDLTACMGCGVCVDKCDQGALALVRSPEKGIPLEIEKLMAEVP